MPDSGGGTGTPISGVCGAGTGSTLLNPLPYTLLSIGRYAQIMNISPLHFFRGQTPGLEPQIFPDTNCNSLWWKYDWQHSDQVSWMSLAEVIHTAEKDIADLIGWWPAPVWIEEEIQQYVRPFMRDAFGSGADIRGRYKSVNARYGKFIQPGTRLVPLVCSATVAGGHIAYTDEDGDGFCETCTITVATTVTNIAELKCYFTGFDGAREWEIRPVRSKSVSGGFVEFIFDSWLLIEPALYEDFPTSDGITAIDVSTTANFVTQVDVRHEYTDTTARSALFGWEEGVPQSLGFICTSCSGTGCNVCDFVTQDGCLGVRDPVRGVLVPSPGVYNSETEVWNRSTWADCKEPDVVKMWYYCGEMSQEFIQGRRFDALSLFWEQTIAYLATARLERPICGCSSIDAIVRDLQIDLTHNTRESSFFVTEEVMRCPFGTRKGETMAWRRIKHFVKDKRFGVAVI